MATLPSVQAHLPALVLLLLSAWWGTFPGSATSSGAMAGHLTLLGLAALAAGAGSDPLRLGRGGRLLLAAAVISVVASWAFSPVSRAGQTAIVLLPAFVLGPAAIERCWATRRQRSAGLDSVTWVVLAVASWSLLSWYFEATPGASQPLGHHNLLAAWLVALAPLAAVGWCRGGWRRFQSTLALTAAAAALAATGSLAGALGAAASLSGLVLWKWHRRQLVAVGLAMLAMLAMMALQGQRIAALAGRSDASLAARQLYLAAGWQGLAERPFLGWGPGSVAWTVSEFLPAAPGVLPASQVVAHLHSLPVHLAYEIGATGLVLAAVVAFLFIRRRLAEAVDFELAVAAFLGLVGLAVTSLGGLPLSVPALPWAVVLVAGAFLAASERVPEPAVGVSRWLFPGYAVLALVLLLPATLAHRAYDLAQAASGFDEQAFHLRRAVALDPDFPLYRARLSWLEGDAEGALLAARSARAVSALWLAAGVSGAGKEALEEACRLDPLAAMAPFALATRFADDPRASDWAARALLAEPILLAASEWPRGQRLLGRVRHRLGELEGVDRGWLMAMRAAISAAQPLAEARRHLALTVDGEAATSLSLFAFRRSSWPIIVIEVELDAARLADIDLVAAGELPTTAGWTFASAGCGLRRKPW